MGVTRLILAFLVAYSHTDARMLGLNTGVSAVVGFFLISGFVMTALIERTYQGLSAIPAFYLDRLLRILPQFIVYLLAAIATIACIGPIPGIGALSTGWIMLNALIVPNDFWVWWHQPDRLYLPQSWSLGLELVFYAVFPLIMVARLRGWMLAASAGFFLVAYLGVVDPDFWGYRQLGGTLFIFLTGSLVYSRRGGGTPIAMLVVWAYALALLGATFIWPLRAVNFNREVATGLLIGLPLLWLLRRQSGGHFDRLAGNLSYGVYLNHLILIWWLKWAGVQHFGPRAGLIVVAGGLALSWVTYRFVETPVTRLRHAFLRVKPPVSIPAEIVSAG